MPAPQMPPMVQHGSAYGARGPMLMAVTWAGMIVCTILVAARVYLRQTGQRDGRSDWAMWFAILALLTSITSTVLLTVAVHFGFGNHIYSLSLPNIIQATKYMWAANSIAALSSGVAKCSVAAFVLAVQGQTYKSWRWVPWTLALSNLAFSIATVFVIMFQCNPAAAAWDFTIRGANCWVRDHSLQPFGYVQGSWAAVSDLALALYPTFIVVNLQISSRLKIFLCMIMGLGVLASAFSFAKLHQLTKVAEYQADPTYLFASLVAWGQVECYMILGALSIPPVWPLLKPVYVRVVDSVGSKIRSSRGSSGAHSGFKGSGGSSKPSLQRSGQRPYVPIAAPQYRFPDDDKEDRIPLESIYAVGHGATSPTQSQLQPAYFPSKERSWV